MSRPDAVAERLRARAARDTPVITPTSEDSRSPDALAAHDLLSELRTRIATQRLPYQQGVETAALDSLYDVFGLARKAIKDHPGCATFARRTTHLLNVELRPVTAKWHRARLAGLLDSRDGADEFRADLHILQDKLRAFAMYLQEMAYGTREPDADTPPAIDAAEIDRLFIPLAFGIATNGDADSVAGQINEAETAAIGKRRSLRGSLRKPGLDAVGLALSGGGIRSATFCVGALQVLADRHLLGEFDYLSTVSGGGYTGSFVTSWVGQDGNLGHLSKPYGPDTAAFRHVRQHAQYLSATDLKSRWALVIGTLAGMLLNWTAPLFVIATAACVLGLAHGALRSVLSHAAAGLLAATTLALVIYGVSLKRGTESRRAIAWLAGVASLAGGAAGLLLIEIGYDRWVHGHQSIPAAALASLVVVLPVLARFLPAFRSPQTRKAAARVVVLAAGTAVPILALACFYVLRQQAEWPEAPQSWTDLVDVGRGWARVALIALASGSFAGLALNINATSPHTLYRDALARTFLRPDGVDEPLNIANSLDLSPYHLINATVNLPASTSPVLKDRKGDFFVFSRCWSGSVATGYNRTKDWTLGGNGISLATAMAVSGAAASPHMGLGSRPTLTALMTLLNIRLGLWIPRPGRSSGETPGFGCLVREMTGAWMSETSRWFNLTDGGHIENLGIYELLRRRCKFIVSVDGEADPKLTFQGNLTLVRHAQIDFGIRIEPRLDDLRLSANGFSRAHAQLFKVTYPDEGPQRPAATGLLLYLKLSLTGNESELLKRYRLLHPDFPHQSTADQFYDEEQFEAYRQLGVHVAEGVFSPALLTSDQNPHTIEQWFRQLTENMLEPSTV